MSLLTTTPLQVTPLSSTTGIEVATGSGVWANGSWTEIIASTAQPTAIAGVFLWPSTDTWASLQIEIEFGVGGAGAETAIGALRLQLPSSGNGAPGVFMLPLPISGIAAGTRVSMRTRDANGSIKTFGYCLLYYENLDSDQALPYATVTLTSYPAAANAPTPTLSSTPWANSTWAEAKASTGTTAHLVAVTFQYPITNTEMEIDIGIGVAGAEVVLTTCRAAFSSTGQIITCVSLPGLYPVAVGTRVAVRVRKSDSATATAFPIAILAFEGPLGQEVTADPVFATWIVLSAVVPSIWPVGRYIRRWLRRGPVVSAA